ncbi:hypothetical protein [Actinoplanes sp. NPDC048796]|uniref:hypothetical protein n=1 Tax=unclassified Actinoplanes TaxID=2626549 RepID=UPI003404B280
MEILLSAALVILAVYLVSNRSRPSSREAAIDRKLDLIMRHLDIADPADESPEVLGALMRGQKIQAIKAYREQTGASLADAKNAVEQIAKQRNL